MYVYAYTYSHVYMLEADIRSAIGRLVATCDLRSDF